MAIVRKNIWLIFYFFILLGFLALSIMGYVKWINIQKSHKLEQENMVTILRSSTHSLFSMQELVLDILGDRFMEDDSYKHHETIRNKLNKILELNPAIFAFGLVNTDGNYSFLSSQSDVTNLPNLKEQPQSKESFIQTLSSDHMVIGRTYYFKPLQELVVPIRKTIRNDFNESLAVMTGALRVKDIFEPLLSTFHNKENYIFSIVRDNDFYPQYQSNGNNFADTYDIPIPYPLIQSIFKTIENSYNINSEELREKEVLVSMVITTHRNLKLLASLQYDKTYKQWILVQKHYNVILSEFLTALTIYIAVFITVSILFFFLFRLVARAEMKRNADLLYQATHDTLTNLPNRAYMNKHSKNWIYENIPFGLIYINIDNFKTINDSFGHHCGDAVLIEVAKRLLSIMPPPQSIVIRHSGDEFVICTYEHLDEALLRLAEEIIQGLSKPYKIDQLTFRIGISIGIAKFPEHGTTFDALLQAADIALLESKKIKNRACIFENTMGDGYLRNIHIEQALHNAIEDNELYMLYQPQVDCNGHFIGVEALLRWNSKTLGFIPPNHFIPVAETSGHILSIGRFVVNAALYEMQEVHAELNTCFKVSINISVKQFLDTTFLESLLYSIKKTQICEVFITLEVTESLFIEDIERILPLLHTIKSHGIQISMDDFGTGYSSLNMLRKLPINELKIDKSFVDEICNDENALKMAQSIITIGKNLGMSVLAEGVETLEQKNLLTQLGCDKFQGYYFSKPLSKKDLLDFIKTIS